MGKLFFGVLVYLFNSTRPRGRSIITDACHAGKLWSNQMKFMSNSSVDHYVLKNIKCVPLHYGAMCIKLTTRIFPFDVTIKHVILCFNISLKISNAFSIKPWNEQMHNIFYFFNIQWGKIIRIFIYSWLMSQRYIYIYIFSDFLLHVGTNKRLHFPSAQNL